MRKALSLSFVEASPAVVASTNMACTLDFDKIQTLSPSETERDLFAWDESTTPQSLSVNSSELDHAQESLFESMRSG